jgi:hypothetical protein
MKHKECFLNDETCSPIHKETGKPVIKEAHILSRSATMKQLCRDVNGQKEVYKASTQQSERWKKASAYHCFCGDHDTEIFKPIENDNSFDTESKEQLFLHSFRSFAFEYHHQRIDLDSRFSIANGLNDILSSFSNFISEENTPDNDRTNELESRYDDNMYAHERVKKELIRVYKDKDYDALLYKAFVIDEKFAFASAGTLMAEIISSNDGSIFYNDENEPLLGKPAIMLTVFPDPSTNSTNIILSCLKIDKNATWYLNKFNSMNQQEILLAISSLMLTTNRDNTFFHPSYWEAIKKHPKKDSLDKELKKDRGFDLLADTIKLSEFNLFDKNLIWGNINTDL